MRILRFSGRVGIVTALLGTGYLVGCRREAVTAASRDPRGLLRAVQVAMEANDVGAFVGCSWPHDGSYAEVLSEMHYYGQSVISLFAAVRDKYGEKGLASFRLEQHPDTLDFGIYAYYEPNWTDEARVEFSGSNGLVRVKYSDGRFRELPIILRGRTWFFDLTRMLKGDTCEVWIETFRSLRRFVVAGISMVTGCGDPITLKKAIFEYSRRSQS